MSSYNIRFGKVAKDRRIKMNLTQAEVSEELGISESYWGALERGDGTPSFQIFCAAAHLLKFSADEIIGAIDPPNSQTYYELQEMLARFSDAQLDIVLSTAIAVDKNIDAFTTENDVSKEK